MTFFGRGELSWKAVEFTLRQLGFMVFYYYIYVMRIPSTRLRLPQAEIERCKWGLKMLINFTRTVIYLPDDTQSVDCVPNIRKTKKKFFYFHIKDDVKRKYHGNNPNLWIKCRHWVITIWKALSHLNQPTYLSGQFTYSGWGQLENQFFYRYFPEPNQTTKIVTQFRGNWRPGTIYGVAVE